VDRFFLLQRPLLLHFLFSTERISLTRATLCPSWYLFPPSFGCFFSKRGTLYAQLFPIRLSSSPPHLGVCSLFYGTATWPPAGLVELGPSGGVQSSPPQYIVFKQLSPLILSHLGLILATFSCTMRQSPSPHCFRDVPYTPFLNLTGINCSRPTNLLLYRHLVSQGSPNLNISASRVVRRDKSFSGRSSPQIPPNAFSFREFLILHLSRFSPNFPFSLSPIGPYYFTPSDLAGGHPHRPFSPSLL